MIVFKKLIPWGKFLFLVLSWQGFSIWVVYIHYKLICSYSYRAEQNNKTSLKNTNEWFIFMTEVDLCQSEKRFFLDIR